MARETSLAGPLRSDGEIDRLLVDALRGRRGLVTRADAVAMTGLSLDETEAGLRRLAATYRSHLAVTEGGELLYSFAPAMVRRDAVPLTERLRHLGQALWRGFTVFFKVWIAVTLVAYVVAFVAMLIALAAARGSGDGDDRDDGFGGPWLLYWLMPDWAPAHARQRRRSGPRKRFYRTVFDFVFGPPPPARDRFADEKRVVGYLRGKGGRLTAADLVALTGWSYQRADEEATRLLARYDGEPEVAEDGALVYCFRELRRTAEVPAGEERLPFVWQRSPELAPLTGNSPTANVLVGGLSAFNLIAALTIGQSFAARFGLGGVATLLITWVPLIFSLLFFAIPAGRSLRRRWTQRSLRRRRARHALLRHLVEGRGKPVLPDELCARVAAELEAPSRLVRDQLEALLRELDGDVVADDEGRTTYAFPRLAEELAAVEHARSRAPLVEAEVGAVVFSSDDDEPLPPRLRPN